GSRATSSSASIAMAIRTNPGGATLSGTTPQTAASGLATFGDLSLDKIANGYTLSATSGGLTGATSNTFNVTNGTWNWTGGSNNWTNTASWTYGRAHPSPDNVTIDAPHRTRIPSLTAAQP